MRFRLFASAIALVAAPLARAAASPPPPPPQYVMDVATLLTENEDAGTAARLASFIADDVRVYENAKLVVNGKAAWMRQETNAKISRGGTLAFSEGWKDGGTLMIVDEYDTVDRSNLPPNFVADPRTATRATLYQFGSDGKIHAINTVIAGGFWIKR